MAYQPTDNAVPGGPSMSRRSLLGLALATGVLAPLISAGAARADSGTSTGGDRCDVTDARDAATLT